ncbi:hypothetical protein AO1008_04802 [Aspergillus oryzae 100-8]|uniref:Uncharacterized protein n=1 Tax=Aspergillus oryzae (strain 3.042) TaxID=1160506 RepID=I8I9A6_ASPO3|nr:hypothetical protein Ao3042_10377 [Aspergillus oryzae 3.042]KDE78511.1 hypothetical protein AO1008_04802 [Aspergillus oryzae 100-8]|eukprot:EIT73761.1 hypothetical protein Ao3042_10377 [Aspergillus oryzae 3.042]
MKILSVAPSVNLGSVATSIPAVNFSRPNVGCSFAIGIGGSIIAHSEIPTREAVNRLVDVHQDVVKYGIQRRTILDSIALHIDLAVVYITLGRSHQSHILKGKVKIGVLNVMEEFRQVESINNAIHKPFSLLGLSLASVEQAYPEITSGVVDVTSHRELALAVAEILVNDLFLLFDLVVFCAGVNRIGRLCFRVSSLFLGSIFDGLGFFLFLFLIFFLLTLIGLVDLWRLGPNFNIQSCLLHGNFRAFNLEVSNITVYGQPS